MKEADIVEIIKTELKKRYKTIVRDYHKLESNDDRFKGYGENMGISILSDISNRYYVTINIIRHSNTIKYNFREDDATILDSRYPFNEFENSFYYFLELLEEYIDSLNKWHKKASKLESKKIPQDFIRNLKLGKIINE
jgi:hypothetical protein